MSSPLEKRVTMVECTGGGLPPSLTLNFATVEDMQAASDYIRAAHTKLTETRRKRAMDSIVAAVLGRTASAGERTDG